MSNEYEMNECISNKCQMNKQNVKWNQMNELTTNEWINVKRMH